MHTAYMHTAYNIHTYIHTYLHTYIHTYIHTCMHACMHAWIHTYIHTYIQENHMNLESWNEIVVPLVKCHCLRMFLFQTTLPRLKIWGACEGAGRQELFLWSARLSVVVVTVLKCLQCQSSMLATVQWHVVSCVSFRLNEISIFAKHKTTESRTTVTFTFTITSRLVCCTRSLLVIVFVRQKENQRLTFWNIPNGCSMEGSIKQSQGINKKDWVFHRKFRKGDTWSLWLVCTFMCQESDHRAFWTAAPPSL